MEAPPSIEVTEFIVALTDAELRRRWTADTRAEAVEYYEANFRKLSEKAKQTLTDGEFKDVVAAVEAEHQAAADYFGACPHTYMVPWHG
jgi:hypothetical protein